MLNQDNPRRVISQNKEFVNNLVQLIIKNPVNEFKNEVICLLESLQVN